MKQILISDESHSAAKAAAAKDRLPLFRWIEKAIRSVCGSEPESQPVHEMSLEDRLSASVKKAVKP